MQPPRRPDCELHPLGQGGTPLNQQLEIGATNLPVIGTTFRVTCKGPNFTFARGQQIAQPLFVHGTTPQLFTIPPTLLFQQPTGCIAYVVPDVPALIGAQFIGQGMCVFRQSGIAGSGYDAVATSNAAVIVLGVQVAGV